MKSKQVILPAVCGAFIAIFAVVAAICVVAQPAAEAHTSDRHRPKSERPAARPSTDTGGDVASRPAPLKAQSVARPAPIQLARVDTPRTIEREAPVENATVKTVVTPVVAAVPVNDHARLSALLATHEVKALPKPEKQSRALVELGRNLFFDKVLSGNKDIACATCHHPSFKSGDELSLPIGTRGIFLGKRRKLGYGRGFIPRNSPEVFNRGFGEWRSMFWDSRVSRNKWGKFTTPAGSKLPSGLNSVLAAQAMFPVTSRDEMRGRAGEIDTQGMPNEIALFADTDFRGIWRGLMKRLRDIPAYERLFESAYPSEPVRHMGFEYAANAIAAFETEAFTLLNSPWDRYLGGDKSALGESELKGAILFYGKANCVSCHSGSLFTDQEHHNIAVPQLGPGKHKSQLDFGLNGETGLEDDLFKFRTPPLRNTANTGPWMHNGAFTSLEDAVRHHLDPVRSVLNYSPKYLRPELQKTTRDDPEVQVALLKSLDPKLRTIAHLEEDEIQDLMSFLHALTDPAVKDVAHVAPYSVPSGLDVDR